MLLFDLAIRLSGFVEQNKRSELLSKAQRVNALRLRYDLLALFL